MMQSKTEQSPQATAKGPKEPERWERIRYLTGLKGQKQLLIKCPCGAQLAVYFWNWKGNSCQVCGHCNRRLEYESGIAHPPLPKGREEQKTTQHRRAPWRGGARR